MSTFDNREKNFENKFAHDEHLQFKAKARRNKHLAHWAAEKLGITGAAVAAYVKDVVEADLAEAGDDDVVRKIKADFNAKNVNQSEHQIRRTMDEYFAQAKKEIQAE